MIFYQTIYLWLATCRCFPLLHVDVSPYWPPQTHAQSCFSSLAIDGARLDIFWKNNAANYVNNFPLVHLFDISWLPYHNSPHLTIIFLIDNSVLCFRRVKQLSLEYFSQTQFSALKPTTNLTKCQSMWKTRRQAGMAKNWRLSFF